MYNSSFAFARQPRINKQQGTAKYFTAVIFQCQLATVLHTGRILCFSLGKGMIRTPIAHLIVQGPLYVAGKSNQIRVTKTELTVDSFF